jgi:hypothetical protein
MNTKISDAVDRLAQVIRKVDGYHSLGAAALAEAIIAEYPNHPQPAALNEVSGNSGELPPEEVTLKQVIDGYVATYGSLRQAAELLCIDPAYLSRLAGCRKTNPSDEVLGKLGLERRVVYTRKVHDYQPTKLHQRTKFA